MIAFLTNLYLIVMLSGAVSNIRCSAAGIMEALFKVGECVKLYDTNKADLIYLRWVLSIPFFISCIRQQNPLTVLSKIILRKVKQFNLPPQKK